MKPLDSVDILDDYTEHVNQIFWLIKTSGVSYEYPPVFKSESEALRVDVGTEHDFILRDVFE